MAVATRLVERPLVRLDVDLGPEVAMPPLESSSINVMLSPDGMRLVYVSGRPPRLLTRRLNQSKPTELPGTDGAFAPFLSPDGQWVGFFAGGKLNKISVEGGAVVPLADIPVRPAELSWGMDGNIIVSLNIAKGLARVPESGGHPHDCVGAGCRRSSSCSAATPAGGQSDPVCGLQGAGPQYCQHRGSSLSR